MMRPIAFLLMLSCGVITTYAAPTPVASGGEGNPAISSKPLVVKAKPTPVKVAPAKSKYVPQPHPSPLDPHLVTFPYSKDYIYPIKGKLDEFTHIELAENEKVIVFLVKDKLLWPSKVAATKRDIFIKPVFPNEGSSASLITNLRRYELSLSVGGETDEGIWYQRVSWETDDADWSAVAADPVMDQVPRQNKAAMDSSLAGRYGDQAGASFDLTITKEPVASNACNQERVQVDKLNFSYSIEGDATWKPTIVFDDGKFTWLKFPPVQDMPPIFALNPATGDAEYIEAIPCRGHYVVQSLLPGGALLKLGKLEVKIVNQNSQSCSGGFFGLFKSCKSAGNIRD